MNSKSINKKIKKALGYTLVLILVTVAFISANIGGNAPLKADAWVPGKTSQGGSDYDIANRTLASQSNMKHINSYTTYSNLQNDATRVLNQDGGHSATHWHLGEKKKDNGFWSITARLDDHIYTALRDGKAKLVVTASAEMKSSNRLYSFWAGFKPFIVLGEVSGAGLGHNDFTAYSTLKEGTEASLSGKNTSSTKSSSVEYTASEDNGRHARIGIVARLESNGPAGSAIGACLVQMNNVSISLAVVKIDPDTSAPTVVGDDNNWTTNQTVTITDNQSGIWKYSINGNETVIRDDGGKTTSINLDLQQGLSKIIAYNNHGEASTEKTFQYYNPTVSIAGYTDGVANTTGGSFTLDDNNGPLSKNGKTMGEKYKLEATVNPGYYFHSWRKESGAGAPSNTYNKEYNYTLNTGDNYIDHLQFSALFYSINVTDKVYTFNGTPQGVSFTADTGFDVSYHYTNKSGSSPSYSGSTAPTNAGEYNVEITVKRGSTTMGQKTVSLIINKADPVFDLSSVNPNPVYNGQYQSISGVKVSNNENIIYEGNSFKNAGDYDVNIEVLATDNYNGASVLVFVKVQKATHDISGITFSGATFDYDGTSKSIEISGTLPSGVSVQYTPSNSRTNAGSGSVTASFVVDDLINYNNIEKTLSAILIINKITFDMGDTVFNDATFEYDGNSKTITASGMPEGVIVYYTSNTRTIAGAQTAQATFTPPEADNYYPIPLLEATLTITQATYNMEAVNFNSASKVYNGAEQALTITGTLPSGVTVEYQNNKLTNAGSITATAIFKGDSNHYPIPNKTATLTITKANTVLAISVDDVLYGTNVAVNIVSNLSKGAVSYQYKPYGGEDSEYSSVMPTAIGTYTVKACSEETSNYLAGEAFADFNIIKGHYDLSHISFNDSSYTYDGQEKTIAITGTLPQGVNPSYSNHTLTNVGSTLATVTFSGDTDNYHDIQLTLTATLEITKATYDMSAVSFIDKYYSRDDGNTQWTIEISGTLPNGVSVVYENNVLYDNGTTLATAIFTGDADNYLPILDMYATLHVTGKLTFDLSSLSWAYSEPFVYDGSDKIIQVIGLTYNEDYRCYTAEGYPAEVLKVSLVGTFNRDAGTYKAELIPFEYDQNEYNPPIFPSLNWTILKATYDMSGVSFNDTVYTYDGEAKTLKVTGNLPLGITAVYTQNTLTDVGSINVTVNFELAQPNNFHPIPPMEAKLTVERAQNGLDFTIDDFDYGQAVFIDDNNVINPSGGALFYRYKVKGGYDDTYTPTAPTQAGEYVARVQSAETDNYYAATVTKEFTINKATYNMTGVSFTDISYTFDGQEKELVIFGNLPQGVTVAYQNNKLTNVGSTTATAVFTGDSTNYHPIADEGATLTITQAENPMEATVADSVIGEALGITIENNLGTEEVLYFKLEEADDSSYSTTPPTALGSYTVKIVSEESQNYLEKVIIKDFKITKPNYDMSGVSFADKTVTYDGNSYTITIEGILPEGVSVTYSTGAEFTNVGNYTIYAFFTGDEENYNTIAPWSANLIIERAENELEVVANNITYNQPINIEVSTNLSGANIRYFYKKQGQDDIYYSDTIPRTIGDYNVKVESLETANYNAKIVYVQFSIARATYDLSGVSFDNASYVYDGKEKELAITGILPSGVIVTYAPTNKRTNVGEIIVEAKFVGDPVNYYAIPNMTAKLTIEIATNNLSARIDDITFGENLNIIVTNPNGGALLFNFKTQDASDDTYTTALPKNAGLYTAKIFSARTENYKEAFCLVDFEISKAEIDMSGVSLDDMTCEYDGEMHYIEISGKVPKMLNTNYSDNFVQTEVGEYQVYVEFVFLTDSQNYYPVGRMEAVLTINKATNRVSANVADIFIGEELDIVANNPAQGDLSYLFKAVGEEEFSTICPTAPGSYILKVTSAETESYRQGEFEIGFKINKFTYDMSGVSFTNAVHIYDGSEKTLEIVGTLPAGVSVSYSQNILTDAGTLEVTATFTGNEDTHNAVAARVATLTIHQAVINIDTVQFEDKRVSYDGYRKSITIAGELPTGVTVSYKNNTLTKAGFVTAVAEFSHTSPNHAPIEPMTATLTIEKGIYNMSGVSFSDATYTYDGKVKILTIIGKLPEGVSVSYSSNALMQPGSVTATARFVGDNVNYNAIPFMTATLTIEKYEPLVSIVRTSEIEKITFQDDSITAIISNDIDNFRLGLIVKGDASYQLYADQDCSEVLSGSLTLQEGANIIYVKVSLEDGSEQVIKINLTRAEPPLLSQEATLALLAGSAVVIFILLVLVLRGRRLKPKKVKK